MCPARGQRLGCGDRGEYHGGGDHHGQGAEDAKKDQAKKSLEQQQKELQKSIEESEKKLAELGKSSKVTQDYVDTLDQKSAP